MKKYIIILIIFLTNYLSAQIGDFNYYPTMQPQHILDEKLENISFAFSFRILESNYIGPLVRLRRDSDNVEQDFYCRTDDKVDIEAINTWRDGANVYVTVWYDQSGLNRNATQTTNNRQPRFFPDNTKPFFQGDGVDDYLTVDTPNGIQDVTNNGSEASILAIFKATQKRQFSFGVATGSDRWATHANWNNNIFYFDPGFCCTSGNSRSFNNTANVNVWANYTLIKANGRILARVNNIQRINGNHNQARCTLTLDFAIGWATNTTNNSTLYATNSFLEFIMYKIDIPAEGYEEIEDSQTAFWEM